MLSLINSAVSVTLPAFAAERHAAVLGTQRYQSISPAHTVLSSKPGMRWVCCDNMMGQTDGHSTFS